MSPLVTAIIPARDAAAFLAASIRSVLDQTYPFVECIVVDDGSSDQTAAIASSFGPRVTLVRGDGRGPAAARNTGAMAASGSILAFLDADDVWLPGKVAAQVAALERTPSAGLVYTGHRVVDQDLRPLWDVAAHDPHGTLERALLMTGSGLASSSTAAITRAAFEAVGGYDESLSVSEDLDLVWRISRSHDVAALPEAYALCRRHRGQRSRNLRALEVCGPQVIDRALRTGLHASRPTAHASVAAYLGWRRIRAGELQLGMVHLRQAAAKDWTRVIVVPAAVVRRAVVARSRSHRWPSGRTVRVWRRSLQTRMVGQR